MFSHGYKKSCDGRPGDEAKSIPIIPVLVLVTLKKA